MMQQTNLQIGSIGQRLELARQAKGVTVSEAGRATKILSRFIEAMEADDFGALSAPVYAKSFIRMYAKYLGLDAAPLVEEYVTQHAPPSQRALSDEVRQNLANADDVPADAAPSRVVGEAKQIFGDVNQAIAKLSGNRLSPKTIAISAGALVALLIVVLTVSQCAADDEDAQAPAAGGAARSAQQQMVLDTSPDAYLVKPGEISVGQ